MPDGTYRIGPGAGLADDPPSSPDALGLPDVDPRSIRPDTGERYGRPTPLYRATVEVDARRTYNGAEVARLLSGAVLLLPADRPISLPDGIGLTSLCRTPEGRAPSMAHMRGAEHGAHGGDRG